MNLPFALWVYSQRERDLWVMFHEVRMPFGLRQRPIYNILAAATHMTAWLLVRAARISFVSTLAWEPMLRRMHRRAEICSLPVPSNLPTVAHAARTASIRARLVGSANASVGHL